MTTEQEEASALLRGIAGTEARTRQFLVYARAGDYMILWGALLAAGFAFGDRLAPHTRDFWLVLQAVGLIGTGLVTWRAVRCREQPPTPGMLVRPLLLVCVLIGFGTMWTWLAHFGAREQSAFWPSLLSAILFVFGLWGGRVFSVGGAVVFALTMAGYFWSGAWFDVWLAAVCGGSLILGGLWLRR